MMIDGASVSQVWSDGALEPLIIHSLVLVVVGLAAFGWCERLARRKGTLGQY